MDAKNLTVEWIGLAASLGASLVWALSTSVYKKHGAGKSATWLNLYKCSVALACFCLVFAIEGVSLIEIDANVYATLALSGVIGVLVGDSAFFAALPKIGATMTSAIQCIAPPLTGVLAWVFLDEKLSGLKITGLIVTSACLAGLIWFESRGAHNVTAGSGKQDFYKGLRFAACAALCQAIGAVIAKPALGGLSPFVSGASRLWLPVIILLVIEIRRGVGLQTLVRGYVSGRDSLPLFLGAFAGTFGGLTLMMYGMAHAPLGVALALTSTYPVWIMIGESVLGVGTISRRGAFFVVGSVAGIWLMM